LTFLRRKRARALHSRNWLHELELQ